MLYSDQPQDTEPVQVWLLLIWINGIIMRSPSPVVGWMSSVLSPARVAKMVDLPAPSSPRQSTANSGLGAGRGGRQQAKSRRQHCVLEGRREKERVRACQEAQTRVTIRFWVLQAESSLVQSYGTRFVFIDGAVNLSYICEWIIIAELILRTHSVACYLADSAGEDATPTPPTLSSAAAFWMLCRHDYYTVSGPKPYHVQAGAWLSTMT